MATIGFFFFFFLFLVVNVFVWGGTVSLLLEVDATGGGGGILTLLLDDGFHDKIPAKIWRRPKMGFGVPIADWFRGPLKAMTNDLLLSHNAKTSQYLRLDVVQRLVEEHQSGKVNHCYRLWNLLVLEKWLRRWT